MEIKSVFDSAFQRYGKVLENYEWDSLLEKMEQTACPEHETIYVASDPKLEKLEIFGELTDRAYGGLPIQIGYCNGYNKVLNALEYHRSSEINIAVGEDLILLLGKQEDITKEYTYHTSLVEAFLLPAGTGVELYATSLHYAPITVSGSRGFRCVVVLPKGTNTELEREPLSQGEDRLLTAKNKWLISHPQAEINGSFAGLKGENLRFDTK